MPRTSFVGRAAEIASLAILLREPAVQLVTITGRSGAGKTRLALEIARRLGPGIAGGPVFLDFAAIDGVEVVPTLVAAALDLRLVSGSDPDDALRRTLRFEPTLLVADDVDRVPGAAQALLDLLEAGTASRILATATAPLHLPGEHVLRLTPLPLPATGLARAEDLHDSPAVTLFCERVAAVDHGFRLTDRNAEVVRDLCRRLDGLPLALELAAARSVTLSPAVQLAMLERAGSLDLGPRRPAGSAERHADLRTAIDWSHRLAGAREQTLLRRMGVFEGSFDLDALAAVCAGDGCPVEELLDSLMELVDINLVEPEGGESGGRFRLLPTIAEFARERLEAAGELETIRERYADRYLQQAARTRDLPERARVVALEPERDNLHAVLARLVEQHDGVRGLALAADLAPLWERHGYFGATRAWMERLLAWADRADVPAEIHARALLWSTLLEVESDAATDRRAEISRRVERGLALARAGDSDSTTLLALWAAVNSVFVTRDVVAAATAAREGLALARASGKDEWVANFGYMTAMGAQQAGDDVAAARLGVVALEQARAGGHTGAFVRVGWLLLCLPHRTVGLPSDLPTLADLLAVATASGDVAAQTWLQGGTAVTRMAAGDIADGAGWCIDSLELARRTGSWFGGAFPMVALAIAAAARGDTPMVARFHATVTRMQSGVLVALSTAAPRYLALVERARTQLGPAVFDRLVADTIAAGWDANLRRALDYAHALRGTVAVAEPASAAASTEVLAGVAQLTRRELEVLHQLAKGHTNNEIATILGLRPKTVMHHSVSIYAKLAVRGRAEATAWAYRNGLVGTARPA